MAVSFTHLQETRKLNTASLDAREALYVRLLLTQPSYSPIAQQLHQKLCDVRLVQFER